MDGAPIGTDWDPPRRQGKSLCSRAKPVGLGHRGHRLFHREQLVGRDNVIAGSDCGFGTWVGQAAVDSDVVWAKLAAMAEGARLATRQFWGG